MFLEKKITFDAKILDVGCGSGGLLYQLKKSGFKNLQGLDPSLKCTEIAKKYFKIEVLHGKIGTNLTDKYDVVILEEVLEHVICVNEAIDFCKSLLKENGILYIGVPNIEDFERKDDLYQEFSMEHINYFSAISLENCLTQNNFKLMKLYQMHSVSAIFSFWEKKKENSKKILCKDNKSRFILTAYLNVNRALLKKIEKIIDQINGKILIWGTGTHTATLFEMTNLKNLDIVAFIDSNKNYQGKFLKDKLIIAPAQAIKYSDVPILISSKFAQEDIKSYIIENKLPNKIFTLY